jgi:GTP-binding protein HflX
MSDTVGFVRDLPHELVEAFRSTLEETIEADLLLHLVDSSDVDPDHQVRSVHAVLAEIGATHVDELVVYNKMDDVSPETAARLRELHPAAEFISAKTGEGIGDLLAAIVDRLDAKTIELELLIPYDRGDVLADIHDAGQVTHLEHGEAGTGVSVRLPHDDAHRFRSFVAS